VNVDVLCVIEVPTFEVEVEDDAPGDLPTSSGDAVLWRPQCFVLPRTDSEGPVL